jgi:DNA-binding NarL/FixJ family response regulator
MKDSAASRPAKTRLKDSAANTAPDDANWQGSVHTAAPHPEALSVRLTPREREVLSLLCEGLSNKAISRRLDIAVATVKVHVGNILRALDVSTRLEAVLLARCWDLVSDAENRAPRTRQIPRRAHR